MISNIKEQSSIKICIETAPTAPTINIQSSPPFAPTLYEYLALLPALLTAVTPLILGLRNNKFSESGRLNPKGNDSSELDRPNKDK
ncbi:hypothetical protein FD724_33980 (plasmid) [Nostoc sp. C057]|uniref:hypothetical protein n=1 Tax=Nostoc sp. C057 TaxID=2576903 RepID=UPI0015C362FC|nr:hypothetical protein [Nostoc sp. C057]QLE52973.1 hypothetical protein FD724_33980 [Nostoc sp. C057]